MVTSTGVAVIHGAQPIGGQARKYAAGPIISTVIGLALAYVLLRQHWAGAVPWREFSFGTFNQGIGLAAFLLIMGSFSIDTLDRLQIRLSDGWGNSRNALCMTGFLLALTHTLLSVILFNSEASADSLMSDGALTPVAGLGLLCGVLALVMLSAFNLSFQTFLREDRRFDRFTTSRKFMYFALLMVAVHLLFLGMDDWLDRSEWLGGWPPGSLVACLVFVLMSLASLLRKRT